MKNTILKPTILLLFFFSSFFWGCNEKKDNTNNNVIALFLLSGDRSDTTNLNTTLGRASATANVVSSISANSTTVSNSGNFTMKNPNMGQSLDKQLLAAIHKIYQYGKDPVIAKQVMSEFIAANFVKKQGSVDKVYTAWSGATVVNGRNEYTYSGTLKGRVFEKKTMNMYLNANTTCPVTTYFAAFAQQNTLAEQGTAVFSNGKISISQSNAGDYRNQANIVFNNFGSIYTDSFAYYKDIRNNGAGTPSLSCTGFQEAYDRQDKFTKPATLNGPLSFESNYLLSGSGSNLRLKAKSLSNSNGLVITQGNITTPSLTIESLSYDSEFDVTISGTTYSGTVKVSITGKINGETLTETLTITY